MKFIETLHIDNDTITSSDRQASDIGNSHIVRFCRGTSYSYAPLGNFVGTVMWLASDTDVALTVSVIYHEPYDQKRKKQDSETVHDRIRWLFSNMQPPSKKLTVQFFDSRNPDSRHVMTPYNTNIVWPFRRAYRWRGGGDYITLQRVEPKLNRNHSNLLRTEIDGIIQKVLNYASVTGLDVVEIDYTTPIATASQFLAESEMHFTYGGSTGFLAPLVGTPTVFMMNAPYNVRQAKIGGVNDKHTVYFFEHMFGNTKTAQPRTIDGFDNPPSTTPPRNVVPISPGIQPADIDHLFQYRGKWVDRDNEMMNHWLKK